MLVIRNKQMQAMGQALAEPFIEDALSLIQQRWPQAHARLGRQGARGSVLAAIEAGERYGLDERDQLISYIVAMYTLDDHQFDQLPWASEILESPRMDGAMKMIRIEDAVEREVEEAEDQRQAEDPQQTEDRPQDEGSS